LKQACIMKFLWHRLFVFHMFLPTIWAHNSRQHL
jgi:hypothetical protein